MSHITDPLYLPPKAWRTGLLASWKGYGPHGINLCKSVESVGDKNYHLWEINHPWGRLIIRGSAFIRGEKGIIRGVIWCNWTPNTWGNL